MKAILEFNLDEPDDRLSHERCIKSLDMALVIWSVVHIAKKSIEYRFEKETDIDRYSALDIIYDKIYDILEEHDVKIDRLIE